MFPKDLKGMGIRGQREHAEKGKHVAKEMINGKVEWYGQGSWKKGRCNGETMVCALCGRRIRPGDAMERALFRAQRGVYLQAYHENCALIRKANGEKPEFSSPAAARTWAVDTGCTQCREYLTCTFNPFDCGRAQNVLRLNGDAFAPRKEEEETP